MEIIYLIEQALPDLRDISFHTNGNVIVRTGARAVNPKKIYSGRYGTTEEKIKSVLLKLIKDKENE